MAGSFIADLSPLRESRQFRLFYLGGAGASLGRQLVLVAAPIQVYALTGSTLMVGLLGLSQFPAVLIGATVGGTLSDAWDRRRVLIGAQATVAMIGAGLAINAFVESPVVWLVFVLSALQALVFSLDAPARMSTVPRLVANRRLPAAYALQVFNSQTAKAVGPVLAGVVIAVWSLSAAFWLGAALGTLSIVMIALMSPLPAAGGGTRPSLRSIGQGIRFLRKEKAIQGSLLIDINANVFGLPRALFPEMGLTVFGGTEATVGLLFAAPGVGALLAAATSGWVGRVQRAGRATTISVIVWGLMIAAFGVSTSIPFALVFLGLAGGADAISSVFRATIVQLSTPDELRGRLSGLKIAAVGGSPRLGDVEAGLVSRFYGPSVAAWSGGLASAAGALVLARVLPAFYNWVTPAEEEFAESGSPGTLD